MKKLSNAEGCSSWLGVIFVVIALLSCSEFREVGVERGGAGLFKNSSSFTSSSFFLVVHLEGRGVATATDPLLRRPLLRAIFARSYNSHGAASQLDASAALSLFVSLVGGGLGVVRSNGGEGRCPRSHEF